MPITDVIFFMVVVGLPVLTGAWTMHMKRRAKLRELELEVLGSQTAQDAAHYAARAERLEQRVQVLERIVTDRGFSLADEIEQLRDDKLPPRIGH